MLVSELITELSDLDALEPAWDHLAVESRLPMMSPACVLAWWRHLAPATARPRVVLVRDEQNLVGLAPFYIDLARPGRRLGLRLPGIELAARLAPLAEPGREQAVASAVGEALAGVTPRPELLALEGTPLDSPWADALRDGWPGRRTPMALRYQTIGCPTVSLHAESFEAWLAAKSSNFRGQMRRLRRQFSTAGGTERTSTLETLRSDVETFVRLHASRWEGRGSSRLVELGEGLAAVLNDMGQTLLQQEGRFRLQVLEVAGEPISAQLFLSAGGRVVYVNGGWDERFARLKPALLAILLTIDDAFGHGDRHLDLGVGEVPYKLRFADSDAPVAWTMLLAKDARLPLTSVKLAPMLGRAALRNTVKRHLSAEQVNRYRALRGRLEGGDHR